MKSTKWTARLMLACVIALMVPKGMAQDSTGLDPITIVKSWIQTTPQRLQKAAQVALEKNIDGTPLLVKDALRIHGDEDRLFLIEDILAAEPDSKERRRKENIPVSELLNNTRLQVVGLVDMTDRPEDTMASRYILRGFEGGFCEISYSSQDRPLVNQYVYLLGILNFDQKNQLYVSESRRFPFFSESPKGHDGYPTIGDLRRWLNQSDFRYALENCFRRIIVKKSMSRLPEITPAEWVDKKKRTTATEIENFLSQPEVEPVKKEEITEKPLCQVCGLELQNGKCSRSWDWAHKGEMFYGVIAGVAVLLLFVLLLVVFAFTKRKTPSGIRTTTPPIITTPPVVTAAPLGSPQPSAPSPAPKPDSRVTQVLSPNQIHTLFDGQLVDPSQTQVLSGYSLKILKGGKFAGTVKPLAVETMLGKDCDVYKGYFIRLTMDDRPEQAKHCSREYARIKQSSTDPDSFDVEVVTGSGNPVAVDGKVIRNKGETLPAKVGSHIALMPDWEFEITK